MVGSKTAGGVFSAVTALGSSAGSGDGDGDGGGGAGDVCVVVVVSGGSRFAASSSTRLELLPAFRFVVKRLPNDAFIR